MKRSCAMSSCGRLRTSHRIRRRTRNRHYLSYCRVRVSAEFPRYVDVAAGGQAGCGTNLRIAPIVGTSACTFRTPASRPCAWSAIRRCARSRMPAGQMACVFARIVEEMCRWTGARPPGAAAPSLDARQSRQTVPGPVQSCLRPCAQPIIPAARRRRIGQRFVRRQIDAPRRRPWCSGRARRLRPPSGANAYSVDTTRAASESWRGPRRNLLPCRIQAEPSGLAVLGRIVGKQ